MSGPPIPPPPPNVRGPVLQAGGPPPFRPPPGGQQQGQQRPPPPQGFPPLQLPIRQNSSRVVDLTPARVMDDKSCLQKLTSYALFTIRKCQPLNSKDKATWARAEVNEEKLSQADILKQVKKLDESGKSVAEKKAALYPHQGNQVTNLLDDLIAKETDRNFEWTLAQIDRREKIGKQGLRETVTMTVFFRRAPVAGLNPITLHQAIERGKHERLMAQTRPPPPQQQQQQQPPPPPPIALPQGAQQLPPGAKLVPQQSKSKLPQMKKDGRPAKKYHSDSSSSGSYDSDSDSCSDFSSSLGTSVSSRSRSDRRYKNEKRVRSYSRHAPREHRKKYYIDNREFSPEGPMYRDAAQHRYSVPDVPRTIPGAVPGFDPVAAAYQAGKIDADAERLSLERERELERERDRLERQRYAPPPRPLIVERPVIIERPVPGPSAIVSYGRPPPRPEPRRYDTVPVRHYDTGPRYVDERYDDLRSPRDEEYFVRREREVEDYIDRRRPEYMDRRRTDFIGRDPEPRIIGRDPHPFAPRRYAPSDSSWP